MKFIQRNDGLFIPLEINHKLEEQKMKKSRDEKEQQEYNEKIKFRIKFGLELLMILLKAFFLMAVLVFLFNFMKGLLI